MINKPSPLLIACFALLGGVFLFDILAIAIPKWFSQNVNLGYGVNIDSTQGIFKSCINGKCASNKKAGKYLFSIWGMSDTIKGLDPSRNFGHS